VFFQIIGQKFEIYFSPGASTGIPEPIKSSTRIPVPKNVPILQAIPVGWAADSYNAISIPIDSQAKSDLFGFFKLFEPVPHISKKE
jgi:hypothetical protein